MEESLGTGSKEPVATTSTRGTTSKLPPENTADNTNQPPTGNDGQSSTPYTVDSLQLVVIEGFQVGRGVARIDPGDMAKLACQPLHELIIKLIAGAPCLRTPSLKPIRTSILSARKTGPGTGRRNDLRQGFGFRAGLGVPIISA